MRLSCVYTLLNTLVVLLLVHATPFEEPARSPQLVTSSGDLLNKQRLGSVGPPFLQAQLKNHRRLRMAPNQNPIKRNRRRTDSPPRPNPVGGIENATSCFPSLGFNMPPALPSDARNWWCSPNTEFAFLGFSYEVSQCQSLSQLKKEFRDIRDRFHGRYVRLYGDCDRKGFYDDVVEAAWDSTLGVHALIWFGFNGDDKWKSRRDTLFATLHSNPKAKFVTRAVQFGSEPLFDKAIETGELANQVKLAKANLASLHIPVTVSDMAYGYQSNGGAQVVLDAIDCVDIHTLPFFARDASTSKNSWPIVMRDLEWFFGRSKGKKLYLSQNGWPSKSYRGVEPNSPHAVADVKNEHDYFALLDSKCPDFKEMPGGGVGWFAHIYSEEQEPGYGIIDGNMKLKFQFQPRTSC